MDHPDGAAPQPPSATASNVFLPSQAHGALPQVGMSEIFGLTDLLRAKGGREDIYKLAAELQMEFGQVLTVIRAAEILGFVHTPGGDVVLEPLGEALTRAKINQRKLMIKEQLGRLGVFESLRNFLRSKEGHQATKDEALEKMAEHFPNEDAEDTFSSLVSWGRYAELFGYNDDTQTLYLDV